MCIFYQRSAVLNLKSLLLSSLLIGGIPLLASCEQQQSESASDTENNKQADTVENIAANDTPSPDSQQSSIPTPVTADITNDGKSVSPAGFQKLSFGQVISPERLTDLGLTKGDSDNEQCYYVSNPTLSYNDKDFGKRASMLYQIIDDKVALITIQDPNTLFYTGVQVGDEAKKVLTAHDNNLAYEVDKYAMAGDYYNLIANINFKVIGEVESGTLLQSDDIKLDNQQDKLPLQIKYHMKGGQAIDNKKIKVSEWTAENKNRLKGQVESIDIGIPEAIYLVEGCS